MRSSIHCRRDATLAEVLLKLLDETNVELWIASTRAGRTKTAESGLVLADALEQHGQKRTGQELSSLIANQAILLHQPNGWGLWLKIKRDIEKAIRQIEKEKRQPRFRYRPIVPHSTNFFQVSDKEAARLARESRQRLPRQASWGNQEEAIIVTLPDGREAALTRSYDSGPAYASQRGWIWTILLV